MILPRPGVVIQVLIGCLCFLATTTVTSAAAGDTPGVYQDKRLDLMYESFETSMPPQGWHRYGFGDSHGWSRTFSRRRTGAFSAWIQSGPAGTSQDEWLVAPLDLTGLIAPEVEWYESDNDWATLGGHHMLLASTTSPTDTTTFTMILDMTPAGHTIAGFDGEPVVVDLSAFAGEPEVWLAWRYVGNGGDDWFIDDVRVFESLDVDVRAVAMAPAETHHQGGDVIMPVATFFNDGQSAVTFDAVLEVLASDDIVHTETVTITGLPVEGSTDVTFTDYTLASGHLYELRATAIAPGDGNPHNDTTASYLYTYSEPHVPLGLIFTNAGCVPCADTNQALDEYLAVMGNSVACIRVHTPWPDLGDIIYWFNPAQSDALIEEYGVTQAPTFFMDGHLGDYLPSAIAPQYEARLGLGSPCVIELAWASEPDLLVVTVNNQEMIRPDLALRLLVAITEDDIYYAGSNGEEHHNQSLHGFMPDTGGTFPVPIETGRHDFVFTVDLTSTLIYENLRVTAYLQNEETREVMQAGTAFLNALDTIVSTVGDLPTSQVALDGCIPNPFNPSTSVIFRLAATDRVELAVYALDGKRVATLHRGLLGAGEHRIPWHGTDDAGRAVASGAYFLRLEATGASLTRPMMLVR
jgi:hypothetical protein